MNFTIFGFIIFDARLAEGNTALFALSGKRQGTEILFAAAAANVFRDPGCRRTLTLPIHVFFELNFRNPEYFTDTDRGQFAGFHQFVDQLVVDSKEFSDLFQRIKFHIYTMPFLNFVTFFIITE